MRARSHKMTTTTTTTTKKVATTEWNKRFNYCALLCGIWSVLYFLALLIMNHLVATVLALVT